MNAMLKNTFALLAAHKPAPVGPRCPDCKGRGWNPSPWHNDPDTYSCDDCEACGGSGVKQ